MKTFPAASQAKKRVYQRFGIVEQLQVVASTAVIVAMVTIISINVFSGQELNYFDFLTIVTVGLFGFVSVYFSVKYGRQLEEQRRELLAINTISEAISNSVRPKTILMNAVKTIVNLLEADFGWIYLVSDNKLNLEHHDGTNVDFVQAFEEWGRPIPNWKKPILAWEQMKTGTEAIPPALRNIGVRIWVSQPLETSDGFAGILILASKDSRRFDDKQKNLLEVFINQIDVSLDNARLFEKLNESKQLYADLYEYSPDMYHIIDRTGRIVSCNQTEVEVLGYGKNELIGADIRVLYPTADHPKLEKNLDRIFKNGENLIGVEDRIQRKDGRLMDVSVNTSLIYDNGDPVRVRVVMRDITETKQMQEKMLQIQRIDSLGNLAGGIAHDFNNILVSVLSAASIMKRKMTENDPWYEYVDIIESSSRSGGALTRQLLAFARQSTVANHPVDVNNVVRETVRLMERSLDKSIELHSELTGDFAVIEGDDRQLQQVLMNLILNARDAMPDGGSVLVSTKVESLKAEHKPSPLANDGRYIVVRVTDTGVGIDPENQKKIFEPFFTTKDAGKGTGLGLSVAYGIIDKHKGFISVESVPGNGSVFKIYLPQLDFDMYKKLGKKEEKEKVVGGTERIIVIEDESPVGRMMRDMLGALGYHITVCMSGEDGLRELSTPGVDYDLLILDLNLPKVSGREVLQRLREFNTTIPVIVSTGYGDHVLDEQNVRSSIQGYIQKPYDEYEIGHLVRRVLDDRKQAAS
jgi:two-component system, cell cycle sensor histidine kinase and response regulator CckA